MYQCRMSLADLDVGLAVYCTFIWIVRPGDIARHGILLGMPNYLFKLDVSASVIDPNTTVHCFPVWEQLQNFM